MKTSTRILLSFLFISTLICHLVWAYLPSHAQLSNAQILVQQGVLQYEQGNYGEAIALWQKVLENSQNHLQTEEKAVIEENIARSYQKTGETAQEIQHWQAAILNYQQLDNTIQVGRLQTEQAQAYLRQGQHRKALSLLCHEQVIDKDLTCQPETALAIAQQNGDVRGEIAALGSLGEAYRLVGNYEAAIQALEKGKNLDFPTYQVSIFNSLGNIYLAQAKQWQSWAISAEVRGASDKAQEFKEKAHENSQLALSNYQEALALVENNDGETLQIWLNLKQLALQFPSAMSLTTTKINDQVLALLDRIPNSAAKIYANINLAIPKPLSQCPIINELSFEQTEFLLREAVENSEKLANNRLESFALGALGRFYECRQEYDQAWEYTNAALWTSEQDRAANDSLYLWEWQRGRIAHKLGQKTEAIAAYNRAYSILEEIRSDLLTSNRDLQFDFRSTIEPIYRQLIALKLDIALQTGNSQGIIEAISTFDSLKLAELQNYFGDDCLFLKSTNEDNTFNRDILTKLLNQTPNTALIIPIILPEKTVIILALPNQSLQVDLINLNQEELKEQIITFGQELQKFYDSEQGFLTEAQKLYDELIRSFEPFLKASQIKNLVFVLDGSFRTIPMAALHDGQQFLVEQYAIATIPSLTLTQLTPERFQPSPALALGVTEESEIEGEFYEALPSIGDEISHIQQLLPNSKQLLNENFTRENLRRELQQTPYPILHIATHGQFGTLPEDTFLVIGNNRKLTITELESDIRRFSRDNTPLELLTLTACQTALGDDRSTLGLAGVSVQAGVKSAIASLWFISDTHTEALITQFYRNLQLGMTKAEALQQAQQIAIQNQDHPALWSALILIGNWL